MLKPNLDETTWTMSADGAGEKRRRLPHYVPDLRYRVLLQGATGLTGYTRGGIITGTEGGTGVDALVKILRAATPVVAEAPMPNTALAVEAGPGRWLRRRSLAAPRRGRGGRPLRIWEGRPT